MTYNMVRTVGFGISLRQDNMRVSEVRDDQLALSEVD